MSTVFALDVTTVVCFGLVTGTGIWNALTGAPGLAGFELGVAAGMLMAQMVINRWAQLRLTMQLERLSVILTTPAWWPARRGDGP